MPFARLFVDGIDFQKDKYLPRQPDATLDASPVDLEGFLQHEDDQMKLFHFKRFVVNGRIEADGGIGPYTIVVSLRGNIATFVASKEAPVTSYGVFWAYETHLNRWNHRRHEGGRDTERPLLAVDDDRSRVIRATVRDGYWMADVLHHIKDAKKGGFAIDDFPQNYIRR